MNSISRHALTITTFVAAAITTLPGEAQQTASQKDALKAATERLNAIKGATGAQPAAQRIPPGDPCTAVTLAGVQGAIPAAKSSERSRRLEGDFGTTECQWKNAKGDVVLVLQESFSMGTNAKEDVAGMAELFQGGKTVKNLRIETFPTISVQNAIFVEAIDPARGISHAAAYLEVVKGKHSVSLGAPGYSFADRAQALKAFEVLAQQAASRL